MAQPDRGASAASQSAELFSSHMTQKSKSRNVLAPPLGEEGHEVAKGVQANWIHRGAPRPANPVRRHPAKSVWTRVRMIMILDVDVTAERRHYNTHCPLKGKRLTTFCASLALLQPLLSLTHWIFRSLMRPYRSSSHSAKCVRCAPLRSGGRRLAVRKMIECHISAQPRTPFCHYVAFPLKGKRENRWHRILCHI